MEFTTLEKIGLLPGAASGRVVVVTGAGGGIGKETARAFAHLRANVVIAEISEQGRETEQQICAEGGKALYIRMDVSDAAQVTGLVRRTQETFGPADILINNAILCPVASILEMDVSQWDQVMAVNLRGAFLTCKAFLPGMLLKKQGVIINMVSMDVMTHLAAYIASKQGLVGFSQSLAAEIGESGIEVIAFAPGFVQTPGLLAAADRLAPHLGFSVDQFTNMSLHPGYTGAMPVEDAAAATAYLALVCPQEYHGEVTNGFAILEEAGYLAKGMVEFPTVEKMTGNVAVTSLAALAAPAAQAAEAARRLLQVIKDTDAEINHFPIFIRPMVRSGFKGKAGMSLPEWKNLAAAMADKLEKATQGDESAIAFVKKEAARWKAALENLEVYYRGMVAEAGRITKDRAFLAEAERIANERVEVVASLHGML